MTDPLLELMEELDITQDCAIDVLYLRGRHRHTEGLEKELIALHKAGNPPNIMEFGSTKQTKQNLLDEAMNCLYVQNRSAH